MRGRALACAIAAAAATAVAVPALSTARARVVKRFPIPDFDLHDSPLGGTELAAATPAYLAGSRIALTSDGALVSDTDSGSLIATDARDGKRAELAIGRDAGLLAYDPIAQRAYVADRRGDRIACVSTADGKLTIVRTWKTPAEPYGVALTPDRSTLLVTTIADRTLVAYATDTGTERWRTTIGAEPRGIAISPDGTRAVIAHLTTGTATTIELLETRRAKHLALPTSAHRPRGSDAAHARGSFAALFLGTEQAIVPYQLETPVQQSGGHENTGSYGGGSEPPIKQQLAFVGFRTTGTTQVVATVSVNQPRALAWDRTRDRLFVAGLGSDTILQVKNASRASITMGSILRASDAPSRLGAMCGPDGLAVTADGTLVVWCAFARQLQRFDPDTGKRTQGPTLVASSYTPQQHVGMTLFHQANAAMASRAAMACSSCHPDNRSDGLSWRIEKHELQTPVLAGRIAGTHPFKWDGTDKDLTSSLAGTMKRLGGFGLEKPHLAALSAYIEALPPPRVPTRDPNAVARGAKLFDSEGCRSCHAGPKYTDRERHALSSTLARSDTPSLIGLAASAPYYHDGSAATLEALLRGAGTVHGMGDASDLSATEVADLVVFLETL